MEKTSQSLCGISSENTELGDRERQSHSRLSFYTGKFKSLSEIALNSIGHSFSKCGERLFVRMTRCVVTFHRLKFFCKAAGRRVLSLNDFPREFGEGNPRI